MIATEEAEEVQVVDVAFIPDEPGVVFKGRHISYSESDSSESNHVAAGRAWAATTWLRDGNPARHTYAEHTQEC